MRGFAPLFLVVGLAVLIVVFGVGGMFVMKLTAKPLPSPTPIAVVESTPKPVICPQDALICPDSTYVRRVAPACEFAPCEGSAAAYLKDQSILASKTFVKRNFKEKNIHPSDGKMTSLLNSIPEENLVGIKCSYELSCRSPYDDCSYTTDGKNVLKTNDDGLMAIIGNADATLDRNNIDGDISKVTYCEEDNGQRLIRYQAISKSGDRTQDYFGQVLSNNSVRLLGDGLFNYDSAHYNCSTVAQVTDQKEVYFLCGGVDGANSLMELYKLNSDTLERSQLEKCQVKVQPSLFPRI